jgi:CheY-like chemotaxis protein
VLVVDDDQWIRDCVAQLLTEEGYAVCPVADGAAALEAVERMARSGQGQPDVILLDMRMPVMDGWTFARAYRQRRLPHAPIIVVTAGTDAAECAATIRADGALAKPFDFDELLAIVNAFARRVVA